MVLASLADELMDIFPEDELAIIESIPSPFLETRSDECNSQLRNPSNNSFSDDGHEKHGRHRQKKLNQSSALSSTDQDLGQRSTTKDSNCLSSTLNTSDLEMSSGQFGTSSGGLESSDISSDDHCSANLKHDLDSSGNEDSAGGDGKL